MNVLGFVCYLQGLLHGIAVAGIGITLWAHKPEYALVIFPIGLGLSYIVGACLE